MTERKLHLVKLYTGAPGQTPSFDNLGELLEHTSLPDLAGSLEGDAERVTLSIGDRQGGAKWAYAGHPDYLPARFNEWLKKTCSVAPRIP